MAPNALLRSALRTSFVALLLGTLIVSLVAPAMAQDTYYSRRQPAAPTSQFDSSNEGPRFLGDEVLVEVGDDLQAAVDRHPNGTRFRLAAGTHRNQQVTPKDGNVFIGEIGAVLSGARVLDANAFSRRDGRWVLGGQTDETEFWGAMVPGAERHAAVQDLWIGNELADHRPSRGEVDAPGEWFYDYDRDEIVMFDDPRGVGSLELGVTPVAFTGTAADVVIEHLTITRYVPRAQSGAVHGDEARHWTIRYNTVTANHGVNVRIGAGFHVHNNVISRAGQLGIGGLDNFDGYQAQAIVEFNEISENHTLGYDGGWEAGATKFVDTTEMIFQHNWVHDNDGAGVWFDIDNRDAIIRSNLVEGNSQVGIFYEISYGARIYDNISRNNGAEAIGDMGGGIYVSSSSDVEVFRNAIYGNRTSVLATQGDRGEGAYGLYEVTGLHVHHNDMAEHLVQPGLRVEHGDPDYYYNRANNRFVDNTYRISAEDGNFWAGQVLDLAGWQSRGHDTGARLMPADSTPQLPAGATPFEPAVYGAA